MERRSIQKLVETFAKSVEGQATAHTASEGNRHARRYIEAFASLRAIGDEGRDALAGLLDHPSPHVRAMAACHLLRYKTREALAVLQEVAQLRSTAAGGASQCIQRWKEGTWQLDPPDDAPQLEERRFTRKRRPMPTDVREMLQSLPDEVPFSMIPEFDRLDARVSAANGIHVVVGMNRGFVEFCPDEDPPTEAERLAWWWVVRPDLGAAIAAEADDELAEIIGQYILEEVPDRS